MNDFPLWQLIALIAGIVVIVLIKKRHPQIRTIEVIITIFLYAVMVVLFTDPIVNLIRQHIE